MSQYQTICADHAAVVAPSDSTVLPPTLALYVGGAGNLTVTMVDGVDAVFTGLLANTILPVRVTKVKAATTATNITAMW